MLPLLKDPDPTVRLRVALALVLLKEKAAVEVLIDLLALLPPEQLWQVEDILLHLAGEQGPAVSLGTDLDSRNKCRAAWAGWWRQHGPKIDLARIDRAPPILGHTLVLLLDLGVALDLDRNNKPRWQIDGLQFPLDVQLLPGERVLVAEQQGDRVTERNRKGEIVWEKKIDGPLMAQRLPNGNTFIANRSQLLEVDRAGKEVFSHASPDGDLFMRACKLRNGDIACVTASQQFKRLDAQGKVLRRFSVNVATSGGRIDVLANGNVLIPQMRENKVIEYDVEGKKVWEASVEQPVVALRLPNGNTLATSMTQNQALELDRAGKEVWKYSSTTRVTRAVRH